MKSKFFFFVLLAFCKIGSYGQSYSPTDINALVALKGSCDKSNTLNWRGDVPNQYWEGVTWWLDGEVNQYRVYSLDLSNKSLTGTCEVKGLYYLTSLQCQNNMLSGLIIENSPSLNILNCSGNQLPISELLKYTSLMQYTYSPQATVFEEQAYMPGYVIDYSSQADGGNTTFYFRNRSKTGNDGSEIVAVNNTGICHTQEEGIYFCEMVNSKLSQNSFYSHTANINISTTPAIIITTDNNLNTIVFELAASSANTPIAVDFGDGFLVHKMIGTDNYEIYHLVQSTRIIKIYGIGINKLVIDNTRNYYSITSVDVTNCPSLEYFKRVGVYLTTATLDLSHNPNLTELHCIGNYLTTFDVSKNPKLAVLDCRDTKLTTLDVSHNPNLTKLFCSNTSLTTLDVSQNPNLTELHCPINKLTTLDVSQNPKLAVFDCSLNNLTTLDVSHKPNLTKLYCLENNLTTLDVSQNPNFTELYCGYNNLTTLDISQNPNLSMVDFRNNNLTTLDVSHNPNLTELHCQYNNLTTLDVIQNPNLRNLYCEANKFPISQLLSLLGKASTEYTYSQQYAVFDEATYSTNVTLDYSAQADGGNTTFYFRNRSLPGADGCAVVAVNNTGVYATQGGGVYFCEMVNPKLNQYGFYSHTANTTINLPVDFSLKDLLSEESITAVSEEDGELLNIYPNPVNDVVHIALHSTDLPATITIYSIEGKQLQKVEATSAQTNIDMDGLEKGTYIIKIETSKEQINKKIVKM